MTDIEIAQACRMRPIQEIADTAGIDPDLVECCGKYKAKLDLSLAESSGRKGKLILVTAITPTPAGEGKTTTAIGLTDALREIGKNAVIAMREPSLGPVFGLKGGAAGGGYAQVVPMEDINLHFTGDIHAIGAANNLLAAMTDNHIYQGNALGIDPDRISLRRCVDMNDRQLRRVRDGLGGGTSGVERDDGFDITVATEAMAVFCMAESLKDLKARLGRMVVGRTFEGKPVTAADLKADGAMTALLKDAIRPNLVQTLEGSPALVHGGPFANIAHGCSSVIASRTAMNLADYAVTEAGFGADLGAEKFLDIKCRATGLRPSCAVLVCTARALKLHGGAAKSELGTENLEALEKGMANLDRHISNLTEVYGLPCTVAVNRFPTDTDAELELIISRCKEKGVRAVLSDVWAKGGSGGVELAQEVVRLCEGETPELKFAYEDSDAITEKIRKVVKRVYRGRDIEVSPEAEKQIAELEAEGFGALPVCIAKTQYSFSDDKNLLCAGAGSIVVLTGDVLTMPGLPARPAAEGISVDDEGKITGLF